ncbi:hypothetical protein K469DRAFT_682774 [Zopfia rhizophila CBS 207.26]|uniref:Uncharacterized protein n=1 Tax=Zopfia rhizophila CBS 207.26 TaxID=1314779 RepID=A0A6A6D9K1_9PEZI|nr:hypothetical protein K469DRAFT_682774 [Zopfia rhizophila CBS 207.26]
MPPYKKRKMGNNSSASTREDDSNSGPHKSDKEGRDVETIPPYEYVCIHRPYFDWEAEYRVTEDEDKKGGVYKKLIKKRRLQEIFSSLPLDTNNGERAQALNELVRCALLTALATIKSAGELNPDSKFLDLPIIISSFFEWSDDLEKYALDPSKGVFGTDKLLEKLKEAEDGYKEDTTGRRYKKSFGPRISGSSYDITKMTRKERAKYAFDGKDPLKNISEKDIKQGNLALA